MSDFQYIIAISADGVGELRGCDVARVLDNAADNFPELLPGFLDWLERMRPDLSGRIAKALRDRAEG